jgi:hypothetical protein
MSNTRKIGSKGPLVIHPDRFATGHHVCEHGFPEVALIITDNEVRRPVEIHMHADTARKIIESLQSSADMTRFELDLQTGAA